MSSIYLRHCRIQTQSTICCGRFCCLGNLRPPSHLCFACIASTFCRKNFTVFVGTATMYVCSFLFESVTARHSIVISILMVFTVYLRIHSTHLCTNPANAQQQIHGGQIKNDNENKSLFTPLATQRCSVWFTYFRVVVAFFIEIVCSMRVALGQSYDSIDRLCRCSRRFGCFSHLNSKCDFIYMKIQKHVDFCAFRLMNCRQFGFIFALFSYA